MQRRLIITSTFLFVVALIALTGCISSKAVLEESCEGRQIPQGKVICYSNATAKTPVCNLSIYGEPRAVYQAMAYSGTYGDYVMGVFNDGDSYQFIYETEMTVIYIAPYLRTKKLVCENQSAIIQSVRFKIENITGELPFNVVSVKKTRG